MNQPQDQYALGRLLCRIQGDYPWDFMPDEGRQTFQRHAEEFIKALDSPAFPDHLRPPMTRISGVSLGVLERAAQAGMAPLNAAERNELLHLRNLINNPQTVDFLASVKAEAAHQRHKWGEPHDRKKSSENWFWLVGYLAGKALRASITGDKFKAKHHTISSAAALANWFEAIIRDESNAGLGEDADMKAKEYKV